MLSFLLLVCVLAWPPALPVLPPGAGPSWGALAAGVPAEGPAVLSPLIGPAQERDAIARQQQQYGPHVSHSTNERPERTKRRN